MSNLKLAILTVQEARRLKGEEKKAELVAPWIDAFYDCVERWLAAAENPDKPSKQPLTRDVDSAVLLGDNWARIVTGAGTFYIAKTLAGWNICAETKCPTCGASKVPSVPLMGMADVLAAVNKNPAPIASHRCY